MNGAINLLGNTIRKKSNRNPNNKPRLFLCLNFSYSITSFLSLFVISTTLTLTLEYPMNFQIHCYSHFQGLSEFLNPS